MHTHVCQMKHTAWQWKHVFRHNLVSAALTSKKKASCPHEEEENVRTIQLFRSRINIFPKKCKLYQHHLPCQRLPPWRSFLSCRSSFPCVQQKNHIGDSLAGHMEGQIIGIDFGSVGSLKSWEEGLNTTTTKFSTEFADYYFSDHLVNKWTWAGSR